MSDATSQPTVVSDNRINNRIPAACLLHTDNRTESTTYQQLFIWEHDIFRIGRDPCSNSFVIAPDPGNLVSRNHCEIYVIVYSPRVHHIYVRDRKSFNGTYVNGKLIGNVENLSSGYLLSEGDEVEIRPYWKFVFQQTWRPGDYELTQLQLQECKLFDTRYMILPRSVGNGAEAVAHLAVDLTNNGKQIVCKLTKLDTTSNIEPRERVRRALQEADILRQLQHPNILRYIDAICSPYTLYTFTELASGGDLCSFIMRNNPVAELDTRIIVRQITRALRFLHSKGIVHRDLKPENILLAYSPKIACHRVMLSDFGVCTVPSRNRMTTHVGTMLYQAPEIALRQVQTETIDIWSLGILVLAMLLGNTSIIDKMPKNEQSTTSQYLVKKMSETVPAASSNAKDFVLQCVQILPCNRMSSKDADRHSWLCTPETHLQFFQQLDRRVTSNWKSENHIKPLPMDIPDVAGKSSTRITTQIIEVAGGKSTSS